MRTTLSPAPTRSSFSIAARRQDRGTAMPSREASSQPSRPRIHAPRHEIGLRPRCRAKRLPQSDGLARSTSSRKPAPERYRARRCRRPWPTDCRRRSSRACRAACRLRRRSVARIAPSGKPPPMPLAIAMMSGVMPAYSWANKRAGAADAGLHFVEDEQQSVLVAQLAKAVRGIAAEQRATPPSPCTGSIMMAAVSAVDGSFRWRRDRRTARDRNRRRLAEAFQMLRVAGCRQASPACGRGRRLQM